MKQPQSPIFTRTYDLILWLLEHTAKFPKNERFRMARRIEDAGFAFQEYIIRASQNLSGVEFLKAADVELIKLRTYIRMSHDRKLTNLDQYHYAAEKMVEIGKLLGGWLRSLEEKI